MSKNNTKIGIIGGGQLGYMISMAAFKLGLNVFIYSTSNNDPCSKITKNFTCADYNNKEALLKFSQQVDCITIETENIPLNTIKFLAKHCSIYPNVNIIQITQNRLLEKQYIEQNAQPVPWSQVNSKKHLQDLVTNFGLPIILKTKLSGYDGKGQIVIKNQQDITNLDDSLDYSVYIVEKKIEFIKEVSVIVSRDHNGNIKLFPISENIHKDNIMHTSTVPAKINNQHITEINNLAKNIAKSLDLIGLLAIEMFITKEDKIIINEMAPRVHNTGHWSIEACSISQFEQIVRIMTKMPIGDCKLIHPAVTENIIGQDIKNKKEILINNHHVYFYGKTPSKDNKRKLGHITRLT